MKGSEGRKRFVHSNAEKLRALRAELKFLVLAWEILDRCNVPCFFPRMLQEGVGKALRLPLRRQHFLIDLDSVFPGLRDGTDAKSQLMIVPLTKTYLLDRLFFSIMTGSNETVTKQNLLLGTREMPEGTRFITTTLSGGMVSMLMTVTTGPYAVSD